MPLIVMSSEAFLIDCTSRINTNNFKCWFWSVWTPNSTYVTSFFKYLYTTIIQKRGRRFYFFVFSLLSPHSPSTQIDTTSYNRQGTLRFIRFWLFSHWNKCFKDLSKLCTVLAKFLLNLYSVNTKQMFTSPFAIL